MTLLNNDGVLEGDRNYLPQQAVIKQTSTTTKLRAKLDTGDWNIIVYVNLTNSCVDHRLDKMHDICEQKSDDEIDKQMCSSILELFDRQYAKLMACLEI